MKPGQQKGIDTLRMTDSQRKALLSRLEEYTDDSRYSEVRGAIREPYDPSVAVVARVLHPGGSASNYMIHPRNLSRTGMSFLHGSYVHEQTACEVHLPTIVGKTAVVSAKIVWCRHVAGRVHEVGVHFDRPIVMDAFIPNAAEGGKSQEGQVWSQLDGQVLYVEDSVDERGLMEFHFRSHGVSIVSVADGLTALERVESNPFQVIIMSDLLPGMTGPELIEALRASDFTRPIIMFSADGSQQMRQDALSKGATAVLDKPFEFEKLLELFGEHLSCLVAPPERESIFSAHWSNVQMRPLILEFLGRLHQQIEQLRSLVTDAANNAIVEKLCLQVRGSAGGYGFPQISAAAMKLHESVAAKAKDQIDAAMTELTELTAGAYEVRRVEAPVQGAPRA